MSQIDETTPTAAPFPTTVMLAGIAWIMIGGLGMCNALVMVGMAGAAANQKDAAAAGSACTPVAVGGVALCFLFVGVQTVRGTAKDTLGNAVGSLVFAAFNFLACAAVAVGGEPIVAAVSSVIGFGLVAAGVLALVGRGAYRQWRAASPRGKRTGPG